MRGLRHASDRNACDRKRGHSASLCKDENVKGGNHYNKYATKNPIERMLVQGFLQTIRDLVSKTGANAIHEVGCGEGYLLQELAVPGRSLRGSDLCQETVSAARTRLEDLGTPIPFECMNLYNLSPAQHATELVMCCEVLEHVEDPEGAINILKSLAQPYLLVSVPREPLWRILNMGRLSYLKDFGNTPGHINHWSTRSFVRFLERHVAVLEVRTPLPWTVVLCKVVP